MSSDDKSAGAAGRSKGRIARYLHALAVLTGRRLINNWQFVLALFFGILLAASIAAAVPIYSAGSLHDSFIAEWIEVDTFRPPFTLILSYRSGDGAEVARRSRVESFSSALRQRVPAAVGLSPENQTAYGRIGSRAFVRQNVENPDLTSPRADVAFMENLTTIAEIVEGRWYDPESGGVEAVVDLATFENLELTAGATYNYFVRLADGREIPVPVTITGVFRAKSGTTTEQWIYPPPYHRVVFVPPDTFHSFFLDDMAIPARQYDLQWVFDFQAIRAHQLGSLIDTVAGIEEYAAEQLGGTELWLSPLEFFRDFNTRMEQIRSFIFVLAVPTLAMAVYYVALMAALSFRRRETEIVVLMSRGAGRLQVVVSFLIEWLLVCGFAFLLSPFVGMIGARALGSSTGFLSFVDRQAVTVGLMPEAWLFALAATGAGLIAGMAPTLATFRYSIVTFKQERGRRGGRRPLWNRIFLDIILIAVAAFGYRDLTLQARAADAILANDPVFFLVPFLGIFGVGLLCLRIFPLVAGALHWISNRFPGVVVQLTVRELHRNARHYAPLILLIILTVAIGIYSSSTARTLGENFEDQIRYSIGADLVVDELWAPPEDEFSEILSGRGQSASEPPFLRRLKLPGVISAARVLRDRVTVRTGTRTVGNADLMAIVPREFAETAWFRRDLAPSHFYEYLKLLNRHPGGVIVSADAAERIGVELGDQLNFSHADQRIDVYVAATIPYWPSLYPDRRPFLIANLGYIQSYVRIEPYDVWYDLTETAAVQDIVDGSTALGVYVEDYLDAREEVRELRREPYRMGFFGVLSMGFIVSGLVTTLGIFAYSLFSMHNRRIQFGSLRALGLSSGQLLAILGLEHLASFAFGLFAGLGVGLASVRIFLPFIRDRAEELQATPPFLIIVESADLYRILAVLATVFLATVVGLAVVLKRIRLGETIRLGEEL